MSLSNEPRFYKKGHFGIRIENLIYVKKFKDKLDTRKYNGAIFLGLNGPVVKSHGGIDYIGFFY